MTNFQTIATAQILTKTEPPKSKPDVTVLPHDLEAKSKKLAREIEEIDRAIQVINNLYH